MLKRLTRIKSVIAIDLGGTKIAGAVLNENGSITVRKSASVGKAKGTEVAGRILSIVSELSGNLEPDAIGICVPGIAHQPDGTVWAPNIPGWEEYPLKEEVAGIFGNPGKIIIESDRTCSIMGEIWKGSATGCRNVIFLAVGTGIGAGIMCDGKIIHGACDIAGATGWMALSEPYNNEYKECGCFEYYASGKGIAENAIRLLKNSNNQNTLLGKIRPEELVAEDVFNAYEKNDPVAVEVLNRAVRMWGMAAANFVSLFNPEKIIFGGGIFGPAVRFLDDIRKEAARWAQPVSMKKVRFEHSALGRDAAIYGATFMALSACGLSSES